MHVRGEPVVGQVPQGCEDGAEPRRRDDRLAAPDWVSPAERRPQETEAEEIHVGRRGARRAEVMATCPASDVRTGAGSPLAPAR